MSLDPAVPMGDEPAEAIQQNEVRLTFYPPLYLQRRVWIFDIMRRENITDILDIGCGEGEMLCALCNPAPWLPSSCDVSEKLKNLHPRHIRGLDICATDLEHAVKFTAPPLPPAQDDIQHRYTSQKIRWQPLLVDIWKGGLETINKQFINVDCIVSSEVIEHLSEDVLLRFAPILLGVYHPRLLLVTTPSYTFNARFTPPPDVELTDDVRPGGHPDPTGRTNRIFRHFDHKFEWTVQEFTDWCKKTAEDWGYLVEIDGIGKPIEKDEWGRDEECGWASQVAIFTRVEGEAAAESREENIAKVLGSDEEQCDHDLLCMHHHKSHPSAEQQLSSNEILQRVKAKMDKYQDYRLTIRELWNENEITIACGGQIECLINSVNSELDKEFVLHRDENIWLEEWEIEFLGGVQREKDLWVKEADMETNLHQSSDDNIMEDIFAENKSVALTCGWQPDACQTGTWGTSLAWGIGEDLSWVRHEVNS